MYDTSSKECFFDWCSQHLKAFIIAHVKPKEPQSKNMAKNKNKKASIKESWQVDEYERSQSIAFTIPYPLLLLCKIAGITPRCLLIDFMDNLSCSAWKREGRDKAKTILVDYFIEHKYGQHIYSAEEIREMFKEMDAMGMLYPKDGAETFKDLHIQWRESYHQYWFDKWFNKNRRKL